jgi:ferredoxin
MARLNIATLSLGQYKVSYCTLCKKCIDICPTNALRWHPNSGAIELIVEQCTACGKCVDICPTHVVVKSDEKFMVHDIELPWAPVICDLCGGDPACARICPTEAIAVSERTVTK